MSISGLLPALFPTVLLRETAPQRTAESNASTTGAVPDVVVFSSAPLRLLSELASAGLRQLATLLPALEQAVQERSPVPLGHLARAAGAAARQVEEGHAALLAEGPDRVAAALTGELRARAAAPDQAAQLLRTLARQIGSGSPQATEASATASLRTVARQLGEIDLPPARPGPAAPVPEEAKQLLRTVARQLGSDALGGDARALDTAHPIDSLLGRGERPAAEPAELAHRWLDEAHTLLRRTGDALDQAENQLRPMVAELATPSPQIGWALAQIAGAQVQFASAITRLRETPVPAARRGVSWGLLPSVAIPFGRLSNAASLVGMMVLLGTIWVADGIWSLVVGLAGLAATAYWVFRISQAARGVALDGRR